MVLVNDEFVKTSCVFTFSFTLELGTSSKKSVMMRFASVVFRVGERDMSARCEASVPFDTILESASDFFAGVGGDLGDLATGLGGDNTCPAIGDVMPRPTLSRPSCLRALAIVSEGSRFGLVAGGDLGVGLGVIGGVNGLDEGIRLFKSSVDCAKNTGLDEGCGLSSCLPRLESEAVLRKMPEIDDGRASDEVTGDFANLVTSLGVSELEIDSLVSSGLTDVGNRLFGPRALDLVACVSCGACDWSSSRED